LMWPARCPICGRWLDVAGEDERRNGIHHSCLGGLLPSGQVVPSRPPRPRGPVPVVWRWKDDPAFFAVLHAMKYEGRSDLAVSLGKALAAWAGPVLAAWPGGIVVPVPDDPVRRRRRGFSPVGILSRSLARAAGRRWSDGLLVRRRPAPALATLDSAQRRRRALGSVIGVSRLAEIPGGCPLVLVDDQVTTGATLAACVEVLQARGHAVLAVALAGARGAPRQLGS